MIHLTLDSLYSEANATWGTQLQNLKNAYYVANGPNRWTSIPFKTWHLSALFQALWKARYLTEIEEIRLEIQRLEDIANSLPVECWNMIRLEPWAAPLRLVRVDGGGLNRWRAWLLTVLLEFGFWRDWRNNADHFSNSCGGWTRTVSTLKFQLILIHNIIARVTLL